MKKIILSAAVAVLTAGAANAQLSIAPEIGLNMSSMTSSGGGVTLKTGMAIGGRIGAMAEFGITEHIFVRPGIQFSMMGGKGGDLPSGVSYNLNYIQVPVNVLYKLGEEGSGRLYAGLAPYFGFAIGGKVKTDNGSTDLKIGSDADKDDFKAMDLGLGPKVGYELPMGLYVDAAYLFGLANIDPQSGVTTHNGCFTIGVGYFVMKGAAKKGGKM
jgi:hypothetical protein